MPDGLATARIRVPLDLAVPRYFAQAGYHVVSTPLSARTVVLHDTSDRRLAAAGAELSLHRRDGWSWRRDPLGHPKLLAREWRAPAGMPHEQLLEWTRAYRRGRPVQARARVTVHTRRHLLSSDRSDLVVTLVEERLDEELASRWRPRLRHVQVVEAGSGAAAAIAVLNDAAIADAASLALLQPRSVRAPRLRVPPPDRTTGRDLFLRSTTLALIQWLYFDSELSSGTPEALRKLRVALRRLRSDLQTFAPLLDRDWAGALRDELGEMATRLGVVRDAEVLADHLGDLAALLPPGDHDAALPLLNAARSQLAAARVALGAVLAGDGYVATLDRAVAAVTRPRFDDRAADYPLTRLARRPWRRLRDHVAGLGDSPADAELHRARILAKRARYAADACIPAVGEPAARCAARLAELQAVLGEEHDAAVTRDWLHHHALALADTSFIAGELAALDLRRLEDARATWRKAWSDASRGQDWRWLRG